MNGTLKVYDELAQGTEEWLAARCGMLTASTVGKILTSTLKVADNDTSRGLTLSIAAERITGHVEETHQTAAMERGTLEEPLARRLYAEHYAPVAEVGFMVNDLDGMKLGYSPDGLVVECGLIEVKSRGQKTHVANVLRGTVPPENMAQIQTGLLVSGRDWCDYIDYSNGMALWVARVEPDPKWFEAIYAALVAFEANVAKVIDTYTARTADLPVAERVDIYAGLEF